MNPGFFGKRSIRLRLTVWYAGFLTLTFALAGGYVLFAVQNAAKETVDKDLRARTAAVVSYLSNHSRPHNAAEIAEELEEQIALGPGGAWMQIADADGRWIYRSPAIADENPAPLSARGLPARGRTETIRIRARPLRVLTAPVSGEIVQVGMPMDEFAEMYETLAWGLCLASPVLLVLASAGGYWMSGRALKPMEEIAVTLQGIGARNLSERLALRGTDDELDRLSAIVNRMLARLESAFQLVTQFTADASHELRTPAGIIRTTAEVIRMRRRSPEEHEAAWDQVILQSERMSRLIDDLLVLARADSGLVEHRAEPMDVAVTLRSLTDEIRIVAERSGLRLDVTAPAECLMNGDADGIRRLLLALLDNAIKYTPSGGEIGVSLRTTNDAKAIIEVRDTGCGIDSEHLPRIFDRFVRIAADRSRQSGGAGLGLSIARWLASVHAGKIEVESRLGAGSTFRVILPVDKITLQNSAFLQNRSA